ncbi:unnamed protein product, partial [Ixodes hexagonus]
SSGPGLRVPGEQQPPPMASGQPDADAASSLNGQPQPPPTQQPQHYHRARPPQEPLLPMGCEPLLGPRGTPVQPGAHWEVGEPPGGWHVVNGLSGAEKGGHRCKGLLQQQQPKSFGGPPHGPAAGVVPPYVAAAAPHQAGVPPHVVLLHINPGETIFFQMGDQMQLIQGPATVRMVSNSSTPPMAVPVQVPPGHVVQQIVDENGTLRHIILSPQPQHVTLPTVATPYTGAPGGAPPTAQPAAAFFPYTAPAPGAPARPQFAGQFHSAMQPPLGASPHSPQDVPQQRPQARVHCSRTQGHMPAAQTPAQQEQLAKLHGRAYHPISSASASPCAGHAVPGVVPQQQQPPQGVVPPAHKDERSQKQFLKLRKKLESRQGPSSSSSLAAPSSGTRSDTSSPKSGERASGRWKANSQLNRPLGDATIRSRLGARRLVSLSLARSLGLMGTLMNLRCTINAKCVAAAMQTARSQSVRNATSHVASIHTLSHIIHEHGHQMIKKETFLHKLCEKSKKAKQTRQCPQYDGGLLRKKRRVIHIWVARQKIPRWSKSILSTPLGRARCPSLVWDVNPQIYIFIQTGQSYPSIHRIASHYCQSLLALKRRNREKWFSLVASVRSGSSFTTFLERLFFFLVLYGFLLAWHTRIAFFPLGFTLLFSFCFFLLPAGHGSPSSSNYHKSNHRSSPKLLVAHNEEGSSGPSRVASLRTLPDRPCRPSRPSAKGRVRSHNFTASWEPPKDDGGSEITRYCLQMDSGKGFEEVYAGPERDHVCSGLEPGATYRLRVNCSSAGGVSDFSEVSSVATLPLCPGACDPPRLHGKARAISAHLKWAPPAYDGGAPVTEFELQVAAAAGPDPESDASGEPRVAYRGPDWDCTVAGLLPGRAYLYSVRAFNSAGAGPWSEPLLALSGAGPPDTPRGLSVQARSASCALVAWEEAACHGAPVSEYLLECRQPETAAGGATAFAHLYSGRTAHFEAKGLEPASCYCFRVQAVSSAGPSPFSDTVEFTTPPGVPGPVGNLECVRGHTSLELTWTEPLCHGSDITHYVVEVTETGPLSSSSASAPSPAMLASSPSALALSTHVAETTQLLVSSLRPETAYKVRVQAVNGVGSGPLSSPALRTSTRALPPCAPSLECLGATHSSLRLRWGDQAEKSLRDFVQYTLEMEVKPGLFAVLYQGPSHSYKASRLQENQAYRFRIQATSDAGEGPPSEPVTFSTSRALPPAPKAPRVTPQGDTSCLLEWQAVRLLTDDPISYLVQLQQSGASESSVVYRGPDTSCSLSNLSPHSFHCARVAALRHCPQSPEPLCGPYGPATSFQLFTEPAASNGGASQVGSSSSASSPSGWGLRGSRTGGLLPSLGDQQWAGILVGGFTLLAVLAAVLLQEVVAWNQ